MFAAEIRKRRIQHRSYSRWRWHLDEVFVRINGKMHYLWRAVDHEGEVLEVFATKRRDRKAALAFLKRAMKRYGRPQAIVTDRLRSYGAAMKEIGVEQRRVAVAGSIIALKTHISRSDEERVQWRSSGTSRPCRNMPRFTPPCSITSAWTAPQPPRHVQEEPFGRPGRVASIGRLRSRGPRIWRPVHISLTTPGNLMAIRPTWKQRSGPRVPRGYPASGSPSQRRSIWARWRRTMPNRPAR